MNRQFTLTYKNYVLEIDECTFTREFCGKCKELDFLLNDCRDVSVIFSKFLEAVDNKNYETIQEFQREIKEVQEKYITYLIEKGYHFREEKGKYYALHNTVTFHSAPSWAKIIISPDIYNLVCN